MIVAQSAKQTLEIPEVRCSNLVTGNIYTKPVLLFTVEKIIEKKAPKVAKYLVTNSLDGQK